MWKSIRLFVDDAATGSAELDAVLEADGSLVVMAIASAELAEL
jgi:hypothetical protein